MSVGGEGCVGVCVRTSVEQHNKFCPPSGDITIIRKVIFKILHIN